MFDRPLAYTKILACLEAIANGKAELGVTILAELKTLLADGNPETAALCQVLAKLIQKNKARAVAGEDGCKADGHCVHIMRSLLDGTGQGLLTFGHDLRIWPEYSSECAHIFGRDITGLNYISLMFSGSSEEDLFADILHDVLQLANPSRQRVLLSILPSQLFRNNQTYAVEYKVIQGSESKIMVILTDETDKVILQAQIEEERALQQMIFRVVELYDSFMDTVRELRALLQTTERLDYYTAMGEEERKAICRDIHTLKGNFGHFGFKVLVDVLNELEGFLSYGYEACGNAEKETIIRQEMDELRQVFEIYWTKLVAVLGERFFLQGNRVQVKTTDLIDMEDKLLSIIPASADAAGVIERLRRWRYRSLKAILLEYKLFIVDLGTRFDKHIRPLEITGEDVLVDPVIYQEFGRTLIHIFRNMVDHGIEQPEERLASGKPETGRITGHIQIIPEGLQLTISDDGRGIDVDRIGAAALEKGLVTSADLQAMDGPQVLELIFTPGLSTKKFVALVSGRGIGLDAVRSTVIKTGGKVTVRSVFGQGTAFDFFFGKNYLTVD